MNKLLTTIAITALLAGCKSETKPETAAEKIASAHEAKVEAVETPETASEANSLKARYEKIAAVEMNPDTSFLSESERAVVNKLIEASNLMTEIYIRQLNPENPAIRETIVNSDRADKDILLKMFDLHFGPCDTLDENYVFYGRDECAPGAGFYPRDMTKEEFETAAADNDALKSGYTVVRRAEDGTLKAIPYYEAYAEWLVPASKLLKDASDMSENASLKKFLKLRAEAFLTDDYYESEMAWMDLDGNIEIAIGPYEVYDDGLFGYKTAYESFVTVKNPEESAALAKYKDFLKDMEKNLPVEEKYKNFKRGFESPIVAAYQVRGGGDNVPGVQTIAFNLPNDERVREAKGAKKVILNNVLGAKYDLILKPIGERVLVDDQAKLTAKKWMSNNTLFHELSHSLGPGSIVVDGEETTVNAQLKELYSGIEEGKADVMGAYNILYMMERGELDKTGRDAFLATYFTGKFRSMRFGTQAAHAKGAAYQYNYHIETGAAKWLPEQQRYKLDFDKLAQSISDLTGKIVRLQAGGSYDETKAFLDNYLPLDEAAETVLGNLDDIPYDIRPIYPEKI